MRPAAEAIACAGVVVIEAGRVLLVRRGTPPEAGRWSLPGGRLEAGETSEQAAAHEALEETGLVVEIGTLVGTASFCRCGRRYEVADYLATRRGGELRAGSDAAAVRFVGRAELFALDLSSGLLDFFGRHAVLARLGLD